MAEGIIHPWFDLVISLVSIFFALFWIGFLAWEVYDTIRGNRRHRFHVARCRLRTRRDKRKDRLERRFERKIIMRAVRIEYALRKQIAEAN